MITLTNEVRDEVLDKVGFAVEDYKSGLSGIWTKYAEWRKASEGRPKESAKSFPHAKAANVAAPLTSVSHKTMYGALWVGLAQRKPAVLIEALQRESPEEKAMAEAVQGYMEILSEDPRELGMKDFLRAWLSSSSLEGVGYDKVVWDASSHEVTASRVTAEGGTETIKYTVEDHFGPRVLFLTPENVSWDQAFQDFQRTPILLERFLLGEHELKEKGALGEYDGDAVEAVLEALTTTDSDGEGEDRARIGAGRGETPVAELYEAYIKIDVDGDGTFEDLLVVYHPASRTLLYAEFNSFGERMIGNVAYEERPGWIQGIGVGWQCEHMQSVMNTLYNSRMDGIALTDAPMFLIRKGSGIPLHDDIYPGKRIAVDDVEKDFRPFNFDKSFLNTKEEERNALFWAQKNTGASDTLAGFPDSVMRSSDTVGGQVLRLKQSSAMFTTILENYERALSDVYRRVFKVLVMYKDEIMEKERRIGRMTPEKLTLLEKALTMDLAEIPLHLRFKVNVTDVDETFEMQRQNLMTLVQIMSMYFEKMIQLGQALDSGTLGPVSKTIAASALETATMQMKETLKLFGKEETLGSLPDSRKLAFMREMGEAMLGQALGGMAKAMGAGGPQGPGGGAPAMNVTPPQGALPPGGAGVEGGVI